MRSLETRAIENIATAPATQFDRWWAAACAVALAALFAASIPWAGVRLAPISAFIPTVSGAGVVTLVLTALLLYVQYRYERDLKLALLAIAYGYAAITQLTYVLTFPQTFGLEMLLGAGGQSAAWAYVASQTGFGALLIAYGLAARRRWRLSRNGVRLLTLGVSIVSAGVLVFVTVGHQWLPPILNNGTEYSLLWTRVVAPAMATEMIIALALVAYQLRTVTEVWLGVVLLSRCIAITTAGELASARFTVGWYGARSEELFGAAIMLAVFLVKINELMLRLAARNRSTAEALAVGEARYASLANVVPQLIFTTNPQGDVEYVNDRWAHYTGLDLNASRDGGWRRAIAPEDEPKLRERWQESIRSGEPLGGEFRLRDAESGRARWFLINVVPARDHRGEIVAWIATCTDVDATKRLEEREAFLARAGERLSASLNVEATTAAIAALAQPRLADRLWVAVLDDDGRYVVDNVPLGPKLQDVVASAVDVGEPLVVDPEMLDDSRLDSTRARVAMIAPLTSVEMMIGALLLTRNEDRPYDDDDIALVREFARRAALSFEHAKLYERERSTADALQRAMLPSQLPLLPTMRFSASYSAASESQRVGGDFYDAFELPDGRVAITIGDVTGHGLEAAVIMGEIRQALRASAFESAEPSVILDRASRLLVASGRSVFVTAIFGVIDPLTGRFAYASAGHPAPLLDDGNELCRLTTAGLPIGLRDEQGVDFALRLKAPCTLVMFTDGLMEFARDLDEGERRIEAAIRTLARDDIDHLAAALMKGVLGDDEPSDDIAILTVTIDRFIDELPGDEREWRFSSDDRYTSAMLRHEVGELFGRWTGRSDVRFASELAFGELVANAVRHAPGPVHVIAACDEFGNATLVVEDQGRGFVPRDRAMDPFAETGRGLNLVRCVADDVHIERAPSGGTRVLVTFRLQEPALSSQA